MSDNENEEITRVDVPRVQAANDPIENVNKTCNTGNNFVITTEAINKLLQVTHRDRNEGNCVGFPHFDPDHSRVDVNKWCADIDSRAERDGLESYDIIPRVKSALLGRAKQWYEKYGYQHYGWSDLRASLIHCFSSGADIVTQLRTVVNIESNEFNTYTDFVMEKVSQINRLPFEIPEEKIVKIVVGCISDISLRNSLSFASPTSVQSLIDNLSTIRERPFKKIDQVRRFISQENRSALHNEYYKNKSDTTIPIKRARLSDDKRCFACGKVGHIRSRCPEVVSSKNKQSSNFPEKQKEKFEKNSECTFCRKMGHDENTCWAKQRAERKNVNICNNAEVSEDKIPVIIQGKLFNVLLDSGSDISLIRSDVAEQVIGKKQPHFLNVEGIGSNPILLTESLLLLIEFEKLAIEVELHIINKLFMKNEIIVGRNVLKDPTLTIVVNSSGATLCRQLSVLSMREDTQITDADNFYELQLKNVLKEFSSFFIDGFPTKEVKTGYLNIRLSQNTNINYAPYRMAMCERKIAENIVADLIKNGIVRESFSPFASPVILVKKKNGKERLCVDYRALNKITVKDRYPLPRVDDQLDRLSGQRYFSTLDMASGFHQIPVARESIEKTAFITPDGHYEFVRMPFGLANAPAVFQRAINTALGKLKDKEALVYMDDVIIPSKTKEEGLMNLEKVLKALTENGFSINMLKCKFLQTKIDYLGKEVTAEGIKPSSTKIDALVRSPVPVNVKQVRQFMGLANYFRKFIPQFAAKTACITSLTKNNVKFNWNTECEAAKQYITNILTSRPLLILFDYNLPTELHTDASAIGFGAILFQKIEGQLRVVAYYSQATKPYESKYHSYELETLAVVNAVKHFRHYLLGIKFTLVTDCNALKATQHKKDLLPRVARWWVYLQDFNFDIVYKKGQSLQHVDYLSRNVNTISCCKVNTLSETWLQVEQNNDVTCNEIINRLKNGDSNTDAQFKLKSGLLYKKINDSLKLYVPQHCRLILMRRYHEDNCHIGWEKTLCKMREHFWMPSMTKNVRKFVENCIICLVAKRPSGKKQCELHPIDKKPVPFNTVHLDFMGPFEDGNKTDKRYIFILIDAFTKFVVLFTCKSLKASETVQYFQNYVMLFGVPSKIVSDRGTNFTSDEFKKLCTSFGIEHHLIAPGVSRSNGQVERYVDTVSNLLRTNISNCLEWSTYVSRIQLALNTTVNKTTGFSPLKLLTGISGRTPEVGALLAQLELEPEYEDIVALRKLASERLQENSARMKVRFDQTRCKPKPLKIGQKVLYHNNQIRKSKLQPHFDGPYEVVGILGNDRYKLNNNRSKRSIVAAREVIRPVVEEEQ